MVTNLLVQSIFPFDRVHCHTDQIIKCYTNHEDSIDDCEGIELSLKTFIEQELEKRLAAILESESS